MKWIALAAEVPGEGHLARGLPCQDRAAAWLKPRPSLIVLDGRGSASRSDEGAEAAREALRHWLDEEEAQLAASLDKDDTALARVSWMGLAQSLYAVAARTQRELAAAEGGAPKDFEFTLTLAVFGARHLGWASVGDSPLVLLRHGILGQVQLPEQAEFANQTRFVQASPLRVLGLSGGIVPIAGVEAVLAMSDGTASRFIDLQRHVPAEANRQLAALLVSGELEASGLPGLLDSEDWLTTTRDDRSMAILARCMDKREALHSETMILLESTTTRQTRDEAHARSIFPWLLLPALIIVAMLSSMTHSERPQQPEEPNHAALLPAVRLRLCDEDETNAS